MATAGPEEDAQNHSSKPLMTVSPFKVKDSPIENIPSRDTASNN